MSELTDLHEEDGWRGLFTRKQYIGAKFKNGARVEKAREDAGGDSNPLGTRGTVLGSMASPRYASVVMYFVEWDTRPRWAFAVTEWKLREIE